MKPKVIDKTDFNSWVDSLIKAGRTIGVKEKEKNKFHFAELACADELRLDYDVTIIPPKKFLQPPKETLLKFNRTANSAAAVFESVPVTIIGIHPYDMKAINQMDTVFGEENKDTNYLARRGETTIIGCDPLKAGSWSFWSGMGASTVASGFDLWLTDIGGGYFVEIGSKKGDRLLSKAVTKEASEKDAKLQREVKSKLRGLCGEERRVKADIKDIPLLLSSGCEHPVWERQAEKCYSCGSCNMVCPTCYCFDVREEMELDLIRGKRVRVWDGCLLEEFAKVGSGENFRKERSGRFRHRFFRKFVYMPEKVGDIACVGCGRCSSVCLPDITDPVKIINELKG